MTTMSTAVKPIFHTAQRNFESSQYALPSDEGEQESEAGDDLRFVLERMSDHCYCDGEHQRGIAL